jgi:lipoyl-dependent peroxiredoxin
MPILYQTTATVTGGRDGHATVNNGALDLALATPKELGGPGGDAANPEQLFASGYAACFLSALRFVAGQRRLKLPEASTVAATVGIGAREDGTGFALDVALDITVPELAETEVQDLVAAAHQVCPYSHLAREGLDVRLTITD